MLNFISDEVKFLSSHGSFEDSERNKAFLLHGGVHLWMYTSFSLYRFPPLVNVPK